MEHLVEIKNLATSEAIRDKVHSEFFLPVKTLVMGRLPMELNWERYINMYNQADDGTRGYAGGRANAYIPEVKKAVRSNIATAKKSMFPIGKDPQISCEPEIPIKDQEVAKRAVKAMALHDLKNSRFDSTVESSLLEFYLLGNCVVKGGWLKKEGFNLERKNKKVVEKEITLYNGPKPVFRSIFDVYFYPEHVHHYEDATMVVERLEYSRNDIEQKVRDKIWAPTVLDVLKAGHPDTRDHFYNRTRTEYLQGVYENQEVMPEGQQFFTCYQIWTECDLGQGTRPYMMEMFVQGGVNGVAMVKRNPYPDQKHPYKHARLRPSPRSSIYGQGVGQDVDKMQYLLNDMTNQTLDAVTFLNNPVMNVDLGMLQMNPDEIDFAPGMVLYGNKDAFQPIQIGDPQIPMLGFQAINNIRDIIKDHTSEPSMPSSLDGKSRSAAQSQIVGGIAQVELIEPIKKFENDILVPILMHNHMLRAFNYDKDLYVRILSDKLGAYELAISKPEDFISGYMWKWAGSENAQNEQVRAMQLINFVNVVSKMPPEVQQQIKFNYPNLIMKVWTDGFGFKDDRSILEDQVKGNDPETENRMMMNDMDVQVNIADDDDFHMYKHGQIEIDEMSDDQISKLIEHKENHQKNKQTKIQQAQAQQNAMLQQQALMMQMQGQKGAMRQPGANRAGSDGRVRSGNTAQVNSSSNTSDMAKGMRF